MTSLMTDDMVVDAWIARLNESLALGDHARAAGLFGDDGYWRDSLTFGWTIETAHGPLAIEHLLREAGNEMPVLRRDGPVTRSALPHCGETLEAQLSWTAPALSGRGHLRLTSAASAADPAGWVGATLLTAAESLAGRPPLSLSNRDTEFASAHDDTWAERRAAEQAYRDRSPEVLIVGAGHAGLALAARLDHQGVDALVVEAHARVGDNWRTRYRTLRLHNEICGNHLPYLPFPDSWPMFVPKDKLAGWLELYVDALELNVWTSSTVLGGERDDATGRWAVEVRRAGGEVRTLHPAHVVMATGLSGKPWKPALAGAERFAGPILHSSEYDGQVDVAGRSVTIVGTGTSAHDVAEDVLARGGRPTMLQRSPTTVVSLEQSARAYQRYRTEEGVRPIADTDLMVSSIPYNLLQRLHVGLNASMVDADRDLHARLRRAGFLVDDSVSFFVKLLTRFGGYYIDVGASELIADGQVAVRSGVDVVEAGASDLLLSDGSRLASDLVVLCTGYTSFGDSIADLFGAAVAERVGEVWGLDESGELRNMWVETAQPGFYVAGGPLTMCRFYSTSLALLLKARLTGVAEGRAESHVR